MKKYFVLVEFVKRKNNERGYCDPIVEERFDDEASARNYYNEIQVENFLYASQMKELYVEKSLVAVEYVYDEDVEDWVDAGELHDFIETENFGEDYEG